MVNDCNGCGFGYIVQLPRSHVYQMLVVLHDVGPGLISSSLPGHLHKGLGDGGKHSTLQKRWLIRDDINF
jgi:hypothetical protein